VPGLSGTGRVADDLYLMGHSDVTGKPYVQPRALGLGLAGGLLAELMLTGHVGLRQEELVTVVSRAAPGDELTGHVLGLLAGERERRQVRDWLVFLGRTAAGDVARRLEGAGYLTQERGWRGRRWVPADSDSAFAPMLRVSAALDCSRPLTAHGAVLAGLVAACGLGFRLTPYTTYTPAAVSHGTGQAVARLHPVLQELIAHTQAAVDGALLAHRG
jgi:hypothetical protein